jgi:hypothetical protein
MSVKHLCLLGVAAIIGCAHSNAPSDTAATSPVLRRAKVVTSEEIFSSHADAVTAYEALGRLRPNWLRPHGASSFNAAADEYAMVFVDGQPLGPIETLRNIPASQVGDARYYDITEAGATFGLRAGTGGVIEVHMKVREPSSLRLL